MDDRRHAAALSCQHDRDRDETAFGEYYIRIEEFDEFLCFAESFYHTERIGKVLQTEITAQFSGRDTMVGNPELFDQFLLDSVIGTDVVNIVL